jgi:hypothetical protein
MTVVQQMSMWADRNLGLGLGWFSRGPLLENKQNAAEFGKSANSA